MKPNRDRGERRNKGGAGAEMDVSSTETIAAEDTPEWTMGWTKPRLLDGRVRCGGYTGRYNCVRLLKEFFQRHRPVDSSPNGKTIFQVKCTCVCMGGGSWCVPAANQQSTGNWASNERSACQARVSVIQTMAKVLADPFRIVIADPFLHPSCPPQPVPFGFV